MVEDQTQEMSKDEAHEILSEYQSLVKSPAWGRLVEVGKSQAELRTQMIMAKEERGLEDFIEVIRLKAEANMIKLFLELPTVIINGLKEDLGYVEDETQAAG